ncbi:hypothetical protein CLD22_00080 [Rubrivivax gelatinosus]|nr:hypothetical protein [Rubrivivax gelatinosus]
MKISVGVPTYNGSRFLSECLESICHQSISDFEVVVVDDGSSDETVDIAEEFASRDSRVRVVRNPLNLGLVGNWARCVELARGDWIKFVFQDDILEPECLRMMSECASRPLVFCRRRFLFEPGVSAATRAAYAGVPDPAQVFSGAVDITPAMLCKAVLAERKNVIRNFLGEPTAALIHRSIFERFGFFNRDIRQIVDVEYWLRVGVHVGAAYTDRCLATFRVHGSSASAGNLSADNDERVSIFDNLLLLHEFCYSPHFGPLRDEARKCRPPRDYRRELSEYAEWVGSRAAAMAKPGPDSDRSWLDWWEQLSPRYPRLAEENGQLPMALKRSWRRHFGWRFNRGGDAS